jgi:hypothetical protein
VPSRLPSDPLLQLQSNQIDQHETINLVPCSMTTRRLLPGQLQSYAKPHLFSVHVTWISCMACLGVSEVFCLLRKFTRQFDLLNLAILHPLCLQGKL